MIPFCWIFFAPWDISWEEWWEGEEKYWVISRFVEDIRPHQVHLTCNWFVYMFLLLSKALFALGILVFQNAGAALIGRFALSSGKQSTDTIVVTIEFCKMLIAIVTYHVFWLWNYSSRVFLTLVRDEVLQMKVVVQYFILESITGKSAFHTKSTSFCTTFLVLATFFGNQKKISIFVNLSVGACGKPNSTCHKSHHNSCQ